MKYIDAEKLKAEIERRMTENCKLAEIAGGTFDQRAVEDNDILSLIDSLQQEQPQVADASKMEQVEVEKEVQRWKNEHGIVGMDDLWLGFASHFYSLGLNAKAD